MVLRARDHLRPPCGASTVRRRIFVGRLNINQTSCLRERQPQTVPLSGRDRCPRPVGWVPWRVSAIEAAYRKFDRYAAGFDSIGVSCFAAGCRIEKPLRAEFDRPKGSRRVALYCFLIPMATGRKRRLQMNDAIQLLLDTGWLYLAVGAVICVFIGVGAARRLFQGAKRAEPPSSSEE